jgi:hypothetical protein
MVMKSTLVTLNQSALDEMPSVEIETIDLDDSAVGGNTTDE